MVRAGLAVAQGQIAVLEGFGRKFESAIDLGHDQSGVGTFFRGAILAGHFKGPDRGAKVLRSNRQVGLFLAVTRNDRTQQQPRE